MSHKCRGKEASWGWGATGGGSVWWEAPTGWDENSQTAGLLKHNGMSYFHINLGAKVTLTM